ncbi:MAG: hypothetical protein HQ483_00590 [Rhodospirillales bacterium]|nr:hypothetical protein [Rhodospirillales bacterium]
MVRSAPFLFGLAFLAISSLPATGWAVEIDNAVEYEKCMAEAGRSPGTAYIRALRWRDLGGGNGAAHCVATAMVGMGHYKDAAARLEELAQTARTEPAIRAQILGQATQAWLLADDPVRAEASATAALALDPDSAELWVDRAQAMAARKDYRGALNDLDKAIGLDAGRADAFVFRATAKRYLDDLAGALADIGEALRLNGDHVDGLLERGILHRLTNNPAAARNDWLMILSLEPESEAAAAARRNLEHMDVKTQ